ETFHAAQGVEQIAVGDNTHATRLKCFGVPLVRIDIRQESTRHTEALGELTRYLGIGDYESWSEADKQAFLIRELNSKRPLLPRN
ncbi:phosphoenolpyruvate carboxylase, partial [Escherichia sp. TWPC-MK]